MVCYMSITWAMLILALLSLHHKEDHFFFSSTTIGGGDQRFELLTFGSNLWVESTCQLLSSCAHFDKDDQIHNIAKNSI